jgi:hypothetical protein
MNIEVICWKFASESASAKGKIVRRIAFRRILNVMIRKTRKQISKKEVLKLGGNREADLGIVDDR